MIKREFLNQVGGLISHFPNNIDKEELNKNVFNILLEDDVTIEQCEKIKILIKENFITGSKVAEQADKAIAAKIETLCNKYKP